MRVRSQANGVVVKAYAGSTGVLLAFDIAPQKRSGLLGFAIERKAQDEGSFSFLEGMLVFPGVAHQPGQSVASNLAPFQKFRWADYRVHPGERYEYIVHPVYGTPDKLLLEDGPLVIVKTASTTIGEGAHQVNFNRAAGASQAFARKFPDVYEALEQAKDRKLYEPPASVKAWLSRGAVEQILAILDKAVGPKWAVDIAIYEYELLDIRQAVEAAAKRGAQVRLIYHAKPDDKQTQENTDNVAALTVLPNVQTAARVTKAICHDKFIVLSQFDEATKARTPLTVLCGSTNFTYNGVYCQANVVHTLQIKSVTQQYLMLFEELLASAGDPSVTKIFNTNNNPIPATPDELPPIFAGFSPRQGEADLKLFAKIIAGSTRDVLFSTAFDLHQSIDDALLGAPHDSILRFGLQNTPEKGITGVHADRSADFVTAAYLKEGLEGWLKERVLNRAGNILVHTKVVISDFTSDSPTVISGSHNLSHNASASNDENFLIFRGDTDIADCYGCEVMRLYDHYRFRFKVKQQEEGKGTLELATSDTWTDPYFDGDPLKTLDRKRFSS